MYNKTLTNNNNEVAEVVIKLDCDNLKKSLYYRDEGNMNIVVSLFAQENDEKRVIRFKKIANDDTNKLNHNDHKNELLFFVHFEELLQRYFENSELFTVVPKIVFLDVDLHALNSFLMRDRPVIRRNKIIGNNYGLMYRDVAFLPKDIYLGKPLNGEFKDSLTVCIEIKAKQGYVMDDEDMNPDGVNKCRFCYFQYLKLKNERIASVSGYCPIDLFSGKADRMNRAVKGLIDNPQNNLKMFLDGKMIYNEHSRDVNNLLRVLTTLFPDVLSIEKQEILFANLIRKVLLKDFKDCDSKIDTCFIYDDDENIHHRSCVSEPTSHLPENCILSSILKAQLLVKNNFSSMETFDALNKPDLCDETILQNYKIGSTALDCSIMITLRRICGHVDVNDSKINKNHHVTITGSPHHFAVNATIVDLDMKKDSLAHFRKYKKQYHESKEAYFDYMKNKKIVYQD